MLNEAQSMLMHPIHFLQFHHTHRLQFDETKQNKRTKEEGRRMQDQHHNTTPIDTLPHELTQHILSFTGDFQPIAARCCKAWWHLVHAQQQQPPQHPPKIQLRAVVASVALLEWARDNGCSMDKRVCEVAAQAGHLDVLQWARSNGCPWDEDTCANASTTGIGVRNRLLLPCSRGSDVPVA